MKKSIFIKFFVLCATFSLVGCSNSDDADIDIEEGIATINEIRPDYKIGMDETLVIEPELVGFDGGTYNWVVKGTKSEFASDKKVLSFAPTEAGVHKLTFMATKGDTKKVVSSVVNVSEASTVDRVLGIKMQYTADRAKLFMLQPQFVGFQNASSYHWVLKRGASEFSSTEKNLVFAAVDEGVYDLVYTVKQGTLQDVVTSRIVVEKEAKEYSAYISQVFDFMPAVGQFTNQLPAWTNGDNSATMIAKAAESIVGKDPSMISLGGFGGYVDFGFDHTIVNVPGKRDFRVLGNAFWANANPNKPGSRGGSCEPGIIMVAYDKNQNGKPDPDEWYEIAGSEYYKKQTIKNYQISYYKPEVDKPGELDKYIRWTDNQGQSGYKVKNQYHPQSYYPNWTTDNKLTFTGTLLPNNAVDESGNGSYWVLYAYEYGYADNVPNSDPESAIDIDWAVDKDGKKVHLPGIDFVRVYTGINQEAGRIGEVSTEVAGAYDLHEKGESIATRK